MSILRITPNGAEPAGDTCCRLSNRSTGGAIDWRKYPSTILSPCLPTLPLECSATRAPRVWKVACFFRPGWEATICASSWN